MARWQDDLTVKLYVSTAGDFVSLGTRTEYPFQPGGPSGVPLGWTRYDSGSPAVPSDVNMSVGYNRYNISWAGGALKHGYFYGAYRDFTVSANKRYIVVVQARIMDDKSGANRNIRYEMPIGAGSGSYSAATSEWEQVQIPTGSSFGNTTLRVVLQGMYYDLVNAQTDWGIQFTNLAIIEQELTYPAPTWEEVTCDVKQYGVRFGRDKFTSRYDVAALSVTVQNNEGKWTYHPAGTLRPGRFIKIVSQPKLGLAVDQYYGIIDSLTDAYGLDGKVVTNLSCIDISSLLSNTTVPTASWATSTFKSGDRFRRLLESVGWHPSMVKADTGVFTQQAVMANGRTVRDELGLIADSEGSYFFANREGQLEYHDRNWQGEFSEVRAELLAQPEPQQLPYVEAVRIVFTGKGDGVPNSLRINYTFSGVNVTTDIEIIARVSFENMLGRHETISGRYNSTSDYSYLLRKLDNGTFHFYAGGITGVSSAVIPYVDNQVFWVKVNRQVSDGRVRYFTAPNQESIPTVWSQLGADAFSNPGVPVPNTTRPTILGSYGDSMVSQQMNGTLRRFIIRDGIDGPILLDIDEANAEGQAGETEFRATTLQNVLVYATPPGSILVDAGYYPVILPPVDPVPTIDDPAIICTNELQTTWSRDRVINEIQIANQGGSAYTRVDAESQRKYGPRTYQRMDFLNDNSDPSYQLTRANDIMDGYTEALLRVNAVRFKPKPNAYDWALSVFLNEMVRVRYIHPSNDWGFSVVSRVQGIEHQLTVLDWIVTLMLDQPIAYRDWGGDVDLGNGWDQGLWDMSLWDEQPGTHWSSKARWSVKPAAWGE